MAAATDRALRVGFAHMSGETWLAGTHYLRNLFAALHSVDSDRRPQIALLVPHQAEPDSYKNLRPYVNNVLHVGPTSQPNYWHRAITHIIRQGPTWLQPEPSIASDLRAQHVDVLFAATEFGPRLGVPLLAWIPDFQHLRLPEMFSQAELESRTQRFRRIARHADRVIVSSQDALQDFQRFAPRAAHKARVLPFVAHVPAQVYDSDPMSICEYYHLPSRFFYLPNHFWKHKNHRVVLEALRLSNTRHSRIVVVCTGHPYDYRHPRHFAEVLTMISNLDLHKSMIILGVIPLAHVFSLMRQSLAVLQPSLFEGYSTTVEESKSLGKRVILSDIPVHREQNPPKALFFDPNDRDDLAEKLVRIWDQAPAGPDARLESEARERLSGRLRACGERFISVASEVLVEVRS